MTLHRHDAKRDKSEPEVVQALRAHGISVEPMSGKGLPDLLCGYAGTNHLVEVKTGKRKLNGNQTKFIDGWNGAPVTILRSADEAQVFAQKVRSGTPIGGEDA